MNNTVELLIAVFAILISLSGLFWSIFWSIRERTKLDRQKYAVDMINEWNTNTSGDTNIISSHYPSNYDNCEPVELTEVKKIIRPHNLDTDEKNRYIEIKAAIFRLLNYFEYVSAAYNRGTVDGEIIRNSFSLTMLRYYVVLRNFMILEFLKSKRNHWRPFTLHLKNLLKNREELICAGCDKDKCILKYEQDHSKIKLLDLLNSRNLNQEQMDEIKQQLNGNSLEQLNSFKG